MPSGEALRPVADAAIVPPGAAQAKAALRLRMLAARAAIAPAERARWSLDIRFALLTSERWMRARNVLAYFSMPEEVDTLGLLSKALADGKRLALPRCVPRQKRFEAVPVGDLARDLEVSAFRGLFEPLRALPAWNRATDGEFDLVVVPGVAFDRAGRRLGFGAGMYDRFFAEWDAATGSPRRAWRLALAFSPQVADAIPADPHDQPVDEILTERGFVEVRP